LLQNHEIPYTTPATQAIPPKTDLPQVTPRKIPQEIASSLLQLPQMPTPKEPALLRQIKPIPAALAEKVEESHTTNPHYSSFTDSHALPIEELQRPAKRKKKQPITTQTKLMFCAVIIVFVSLFSVWKVLKKQKNGKPKGTSVQMANVLDHPSIPPEINGVVEKTLDGTEIKKSSLASPSIEEQSADSKKSEPNVTPMPELQSAKTTRMIERFLKANEFQDRKPSVHTEQPEDFLLETFVNKKWPLSTWALETIEPFPAERKIIYRYHVSFADNLQGFPADALVVVNQLGSNLPKIELDPLFDTIGGRLREYESSPSKGDPKLYGMPDETGAIPYYENASLKDSQDFYCVVNAREKCYPISPIPNPEKKSTLNLRAYLEGSEIAVAYVNEKSKVRESFANRVNGVGWNQSTPMKITLKWNVKEDRYKPYLEVIDIKSMDWSR
jgi:hypothetical protein